jgi:hypothetical protein
MRVLKSEHSLKCLIREGNKKKRNYIRTVLLESATSIMKGTSVAYFISIVSSRIAVLVLQLSGNSLIFSYSELILTMNP